VLETRAAKEKVDGHSTFEAKHLWICRGGLCRIAQPTYPRCLWQRACKTSRQIVEPQISYPVRILEGRRTTMVYDASSNLRSIVDSGPITTFVYDN